jgi:hypothetical protein
LSYGRGKKIVYSRANGGIQGGSRLLRGGGCNILGSLHCGGGLAGIACLLLATPAILLSDSIPCSIVAHGSLLQV